MKLHKFLIFSFDDGSRERMHQARSPPYGDGEVTICIQVLYRCIQVLYISDVIKRLNIEGSNIFISVSRQNETCTQFVRPGHRRGREGKEGIRWDRDVRKRQYVWSTTASFQFPTFEAIEQRGSA